MLRKMVRVIITDLLVKEIIRRFKGESEKIFVFLKSLEKHPKKGKSLSNVGGVSIKELKHGKYRFYFITDGHMLKFASEDELATLLIKFVRMSEKKDQQKVIDEIKGVLKSFGMERM